MRSYTPGGGWSTQFFIDEDDFETLLQITKGNAVAAAICYFADRLCNELHDFDHQIKLGLEEVANVIRSLDT